MLTEMRHRYQEKRYGCIYHALYALTGEERLLDQKIVRDISNARFLARAAFVGVLMMPLWADSADWKNATSPEWWESLRGKMQAGSWMPLLLTIQSEVHPDMRHMVAAAVYQDIDEVWISDSNKREITVMGWEEFKNSTYGRAFEVLCVFKNSVQSHEYEDAEEVLMRKYGVTAEKPDQKAA